MAILIFSLFACTHDKQESVNNQQQQVVFMPVMMMPSGQAFQQVQPIVASQ